MEAEIIDEFSKYKKILKKEFLQSYNKAVSFIIRVLNKSGINCKHDVLKQKIKEFAIKYFIEHYDIDYEYSSDVAIALSNTKSDEQFLDLFRDSFLDGNWFEDHDPDFPPADDSPFNGYFTSEAIEFLLEHYQNAGYKVNYSERFKYEPYGYLENLEEYEDLPDDIFMDLWAVQRQYNFRIEINREHTYSSYYRERMKILEKYKKN